MLYVVIGIENVNDLLGYEPVLHINPGYTFDAMVKDSWFNDPFVKKVIRQIDNADIIAPSVLRDRDTKRTFAPMCLSSGAKFLILSYMRNDLHYKATMGDNCCDLFEEVVAHHQKYGQDMFIVDDHLYRFNFKYIDTIKYLNWGGIICHSKEDINKKILPLYIAQECDYHEQYDEEEEAEIEELATYFIEHTLSEEDRRMWYEKYAHMGE